MAAKGKLWGHGMKRFWLWVPLCVFVIFFAVVATGLTRTQPRVVHSGMVGKRVPRFVLPPIVRNHGGLGSGNLMTGQPRLLNIFASWCIPCIAEAPQLMKLARMGVPIDAIAIRDTPEDVGRFLARHGDPYRAIGSDISSQVQIAFGSSGVPETFVVDGRGIITYQHIGDIQPGDVPEILAALRAAAR
jgi:cytochrome c biogenesis protein CcmG/thiol:disulfide interchange protein DsbE